MRIVALVTYKTWEEHTGLVAKENAVTLEDTAILSELASSIVRMTRRAMDGTVAVRLIPDNGSWPYDKLIPSY